MHILILGGSGFLGQHLALALQNKGHTVTISSRNTKASASDSTIFGRKIYWDARTPHALLPHLTECHGVINLIGANIGQKRWTQQRKKEILYSRITATQALASALSRMKEEQMPLPQHIIQASAIGYYGLWDDANTAPLCTEHTLHDTWQDIGFTLEEELAHIPTWGFLSQVCTQWEKATTPISLLETHLCILRFAPIIGRTAISQNISCHSAEVAGFLRPLLPPFQLGLGGVLGTGKQPFSWIHVNDAVNALLHALERKAQGVYTLCSPQESNMKNFVHILGSVLQKPTFLPMPAPAIRLLLGSMADELILKGQKCFPQRLHDEEFTFIYADLAQALEACLCLPKKS